MRWIRHCLYFICFWIFRVIAIRKRKKFELQQKLLQEENERKETERLERLMLIKQEEDKRLNTLEGLLLRLNNVEPCL